jgi:EAL domain-containing protein (putative c-di-GMP-specific phosphodiesterase class I)/CheY-like chemotaxis protein
MRGGVVERARYDCIVIDDDPGICRLVSRVVAKTGLSSLQLGSAGALSEALANPHPAIVFLDVALDRSDAVDGIRVLRARDFKGAVQLISGKDPALLTELKGVGERYGLRMLNPLQKPFRTEQLRRALAGGCAAHSLAAHLRPPATVPATPRVELWEALAHGWLRVFYQPKIALAENRIVGAEALARIEHPVHGLLGPAAFMPGAAAADMEKLTELVVATAMRDWEALHAVGCGSQLAVNAPVSALTGGALAEIVRDGRPPSAAWPGLIVEITEDEAVRELEIVKEAALQLRIYDVRLAIDDFGAGYSSFARLTQLPFCELKLDRSFVQNCAADPLRAGICQSIVELAHASGAACAAEGIESAADRDALVSMGCDLGQGFFFARPVGLAEFLRLPRPPGEARLACA